MSDTPLKRCTKCKEEKPATTEFFILGKAYAGGLNSWCKECHKKYHQERAIRKDAPEGYKYCTKCGEIKPATAQSFMIDNRNKSGLGNWCRSCKAKVETHRKRKKAAALLQIASLNGHDQISIPDQQESEPIILQRCDGCGTARGNIRGQINEKTHERDGFLCPSCEDIVRISKGDTAKLRGILAYLERASLDKVI